MQINNVKNKALTRAPAIMFPLFSYISVERKAFSKNNGIAKGTKFPK